MVDIIDKEAHDNPHNWLPMKDYSDIDPVKIEEVLFSKEVRDYNRSKEIQEQMLKEKYLLYNKEDFKKWCNEYLRNR